MTEREPNLYDVFQQLGELKATADNIVKRQAEEIANSAAHRQRIYRKIETIEGTLKENTNKIAEMTPVFERAEAAEHRRTVYKWQARGLLLMLGSAIGAFVTWLLKQTH